MGALDYERGFYFWSDLYVVCIIRQRLSSPQMDCLYERDME